MIKHVLFNSSFSLAAAIRLSFAAWANVDGLQRKNTILSCNMYKLMNGGKYVLDLKCAETKLLHLSH